MFGDVAVENPISSVAQKTKSCAWRQALLRRSVASEGGAEQAVPVERRPPPGAAPGASTAARGMMQLKFAVVGAVAGLGVAVGVEVEGSAGGSQFGVR